MKYGIPFLVHSASYLRPLFLLLFTIPAFAGTNSAYREPGVSYRTYMAAAHVLEAPGQQPRAMSAMDSAVQFGTKALPAATAWNSIAEMTERFKQLRDTRWMQTTDHPGFLRRSSWMYPDDGCFARAALAVMNLMKWKDPAPNKVFVFGDLTVKTDNSPSGDVSWWYHVAPIVSVAGQEYVLDPAIEPSQPLKLEDWLSRMSSQPSGIQVAICGSGSYSPTDLCEKVSDGIESQAANDQLGYLDMEWSRMVELNRVPEQVLGDNPPWTKASSKSLLAPLF